ncbi:MAG: hypothetical protein ABEJ25_06820 [Candidatus Bipolaricaulia bacterium]
MTRKYWQILGFVGAILFVSLVVILLVTEDQKPKKSQPIPVSERSLAHQLAISDAGKYVPENYKTVDEFEKLLTNLAEDTSSSKEEIKKLSSESVIELEQNYDVEVKLLEFMRRADEMADSVDKNIGFETVATKVKVILSQEKTEA